jgi:hypothetical protein
MGKSSTDFDLKTHIHHNAHLASLLQPYFMSLPAYNIYAAIMYYVYSCIMDKTQ